MRSVMLLLTAPCLLVLTGCCCGTTTYTRSTYKSDASTSYSSDRGRAYLVIPGEGHHFSKTENRVKAYLATDRFLDRYLFGEETVVVE